MRDEEYLFHQDVREKKTTGYSARKQRTHCGKSGRVKFPSDYLTKKEIKNMSGECKSYRLNEPMKWKEFLAMPDEHKITYIKLLRQKFNVPGRYITEMLGTNICYYSNEIKRLGISPGKNCRGGSTPWDREGWFAWSRGIPAVKEEEPVVEVTPVEEVDIPEEPCDTVDEEATVAENPFVEIPNPGIKVNLIKEKSAPAMAVPHSGSLSFEGKTRDILTTLGVLLGGASIKVCVQWEVCDG